MDYSKKLESLIETLIAENGSDLHLSAKRFPSIRVSGELIQLVAEKELTDEDMMGFLSSLLIKERVEEFLEKQEMDFSYSFRSGEARLRGNAFFQKGAISIALRLIPKVKTIEELQLPKIIEDYARKKQGFFLVVGPVGQGKSTTLASMVNLINNERAEHIVTI